VAHDRPEGIACALGTRRRACAVRRVVIHACHDRVHAACAGMLRKEGVPCEIQNILVTQVKPATTCDGLELLQQGSQQENGRLYCLCISCPHHGRPQSTRVFDVALSALTALLSDGVVLTPLPVWGGDNTVTAANCFHCWLADAKRVAFEPLYYRMIVSALKWRI
jgi:hypothetical protein